MDIKTFFRPTAWKIVATIFLFIVFQLFDFWYGLGGGIGFPFKFFRFGFLFFAAPGLFSLGLIIIDILFFYALIIIFFHSKIGKIIMIIILLVTFFLIDKPFRGISFETPDQQRLEIKQKCEDRGRQWIDGTGNMLGTCK